MGIPVTESLLGQPELDYTMSVVRQNDRRVALFQANWFVQSQTANSVLTLADAGYEVDLFLCYRPRPQEYINFDELKKRPNVQIYQLWTPDLPSAGSPPPRPPTLRRRLRSFLRMRFPALAYLVKNAYFIHSLRQGLGEGLLFPGVVDQALGIMAGKPYRCLIGVEKRGLIWAGLVARKLHLPFFYYSLELYTDDGEYWRTVTDDWFVYECQRLGERLHHPKAAATIIQDPNRAQVLFRDTRSTLPGANVFYVPVSTLGGLYERPSHYLHESLGIPPERKIILYFGLIWQGRYVVELAQAAQSFPDNWVLVMHGDVAGSAVEKIKEVDVRQKVVLSLKMVPSEQIQEVVASADVGLLFYSGRSHNERLTAFASEKMALYMQCGVPFVAFDYPGFRQLAEEDQCGLTIGQLEELPVAIGKILMNHEKFHQGARRAFRKHYDFANNFAQVTEAIDSL
jgi:glycosyltransferase involved in cell wall biosynthesis